MLGRHLKPLVTSVKFEQFVHELAQPDEATGETRAARLDLVVLTKDKKALLDVRIFHPLGPTGRRAGKYTLSSNENDKYLRYPTHQDGRRLTNAIVVPIVVNTFGAVGEKAQEFFKSVGSRANEFVDLVSMMGVYGSAEKVLLIHSPGKMLPASADAQGGRDYDPSRAGGEVGGAGGGRPQRTRAKAKAAPKRLPGKFAAGNRQKAAPKTRAKTK